MHFPLMQNRSGAAWRDTHYKKISLPAARTQGLQSAARVNPYGVQTATIVGQFGCRRNHAPAAKKAHALRYEGM
jgi:hypothetical protein